MVTIILMSWISVDNLTTFQAAKSKGRVEFHIRRNWCGYTCTPKLILSHLCTSSSRESAKTRIQLHHFTTIHIQTYSSTVFKFRHPGVLSTSIEVPTTFFEGSKCPSTTSIPSAAANLLGIQVPTSSFRADPPSGASPPTNYLFSRIEEYPVSTS